MIWLESNDERYAGGWDVSEEEVRRWVGVRGDGRGWLVDEGRVVREFGSPVEALEWVDAERALLSKGERWAGYLGYDLGRWFERLPRPVSDGTRWEPPVVVLGLCEGGGAGERDQGSGLKGQGAEKSGAPTEEWSDERSDVSQSEFEKLVRRGLEYVRAGDVFQVNLARRIQASTSRGAWEMFEALRYRGGARFGGVMEVPSGPWGEGFGVVSLSPELFLRVDGTRVETRPIKGTRANSPGMVEALEKSEKDRAELAMIVDLMRNDLGRVCRVGSVRVEEARTIRVYPTVVHAEACVAGELRVDVGEGADWGGVGLVELLRAVFPCGSVTGCPKIRAMEIIDELERSPRGVYCGAMVSMGKEDLTASVAIRTMTLPPAPTEEGMRRVWMPVGGGIVADSVPAEEWEETEVKAEGMRGVLRGKGI